MAALSLGFYSTLNHFCHQMKRNCYSSEFRIKALSSLKVALFSSTEKMLRKVIYIMILFTIVSFRRANKHLAKSTKYEKENTNQLTNTITNKSLLVTHQCLRIRQDRVANYFALNFLWLKNIFHQLFGLSTHQLFTNYKY